MIEKFRQYRLNRHEETAAWKADGGKVIGTLCCSVPEEIIHAAGMLPVRILGGHDETTEADLHLPANLCPYCRRCFDQALKGRYDYLDGLVIPNVCNVIKAMYGFSKLLLKAPYIRFLDVPQRLSASGTSFFAEELGRFRDSLEEFSGTRMTAEMLRHSIDLYNENRTFLERVYDLRRKARPLVSGSEAQEIVISGMLMPKEQHNAMLAAMLGGIEHRDNQPAPGVRLFLTASILDNSEFVSLIEECGGSVVADDMPMGRRYFSGLVATDGDPLYALADRYLNRIACPRKMLPDERLAHVVSMIKEADVRGVIIHSMRACDPHLYEYPLLKEMLEKEGLPVLFFRGEEVETERAQQRADIEAFIEMLQG